LRPKELGGPEVFHGTGMARSLEAMVGPASPWLKTMPVATKAHMIAHRYAKAKESTRDLLTYHAAVVLEWDHGKFCTLCELAYWNGLGGYGGKSNWIEERDAVPNALFEAMPDSMKAPWCSDKAEIRMIDMPVRNADELKAFMHKFSEHGDLPQEDQRFKAAELVCSCDVRVTFREQTAIFKYLINYMTREGAYREINRNCQTFAADFFGFLAGKGEGVPTDNKDGLKYFQPYHTYCRAQYKARPYLFLYDTDQ